MNPDLEDLGALSTASLVASQLDGAGPGPAGAAVSGPACANCGSPLRGAYCQDCGQAAHLHRSLAHLVEEVLHGVLHFDTKAWRTLPLLVLRPGVLTRRYIDGQRARHVAPLALFLFSMFLMFFAFSQLHLEPNANGSWSTGFDAEDQATLTREAAEAQVALDKARVALAQAQQGGGDVAQATNQVAEALAESGAASAALRVMVTATGGASTASGAAPAADDAGGWRAQLAQANVNTGDPGTDARLRQVFGNPDLFLYKLKNAAYKFSFLLIPIFLPFLMLLFAGRPGVTAYDHAVLSLYSLSFMALLFVVAVGVGLAGFAGLAWWMVLLVPPLHMYLHIKDTYGLSRWGALWRAWALLFVAGGVFLGFLALVLYIVSR